MRKLTILFVLIVALVTMTGIWTVDVDAAPTIQKHPYGVATTVLHLYVPATRDTSAYGMFVDSGLVANDTFCGLDATQTMTNKTLNSTNTIATGALTNPSGMTNTIVITIGTSGGIGNAVIAHYSTGALANSAIMGAWLNTPNVNVINTPSVNIYNGTSSGEALLTLDLPAETLSAVVTYFVKLFIP